MIFDEVLRYVIPTTMLLSLALLTRATLLRRRSAAIKHGFGLTICAGLLGIALLVVASPPQWQIKYPSAISASVASRGPMETTELSSGINPSAVGPTTASPGSTDERTAVESVETAASTARQHTLAWPGFLMGIYVLGVCLCWLKICMAHWQLTRIDLASTRMSTEERVSLAAALNSDVCHLRLFARTELLVNAATKTPFVIGVFRPRVVLPTNFLQWNIAEIRCAFFHELA
ncbi:MAG: M56 family metallopeptidase, partial [Planctomycetota bacterium]